MLEKIGDFLHTNSIATFNKTDETKNQIYLGQTDLTKEQSIGLYNDLEVTEIRNISASEKYEEYGFTILVRWTSSYDTAYNKAKEIYDLFMDNKRFTQGGTTFWNVRCISGMPKFMGTRSDVCEFVLNYLVKINI